MADQVESQRQIKLKLTTQNPEITLPENTSQIFVSTSLRRYALSTLVNHLLNTEKPIPFEFLVNGSFLRTSIDEYLTKNGISSESTLTVEYVRAIAPPSFVGAFEHDDWVSSVDVLSRTSQSGIWSKNTPSSGQEKILTGSYDNRLRVWNMSSKITAVSPISNGHSAAIKSVKFIDESRVVSGGLDRSVRIWRFSNDNTPSESAIELEPTIQLYGHKKLVNSLAVHTPSSRILSASADGTIGVWSMNLAGAPQAPQALVPQPLKNAAKKIKQEHVVPRRGPLNLLQGHKKNVSDVTFSPNDHTVAYSTGEDKTLRTWDVTTAALVNTRTVVDPLMCVEVLPDLNLVAVGTSTNVISVIDPRAEALSVSAITLYGHRNWVMSLSRDPQSSHALLSGSYDGTCSIWDLRSTFRNVNRTCSTPTYTIPRAWLKPGEKRNAGDGVKIFSTAWDQEVGIVSGSEDKKVQIDGGATLAIPS